MPEIQKVRYTHEAIAEFLIANPTASQGECADFFGYTESWMSTIIHSDAFQAYYRKLADERGAIAVHTIGNKITGVAALALDKTFEKLQVGASERFLTDTTEVALRALGYLGSNNGGPQEPQPQQHMHVHVDAEMLAEARERAAKRFTGPLNAAPAET